MAKGDKDIALSDLITDRKAISSLCILATSMVWDLLMVDAVEITKTDCWYGRNGLRVRLLNCGMWKARKASLRMMVETPE